MPAATGAAGIGALSAGRPAWGGKDLHMSLTEREGLTERGEEREEVVGGGEQRHMEDGLIEKG